MEQATDLSRNNSDLENATSCPLCKNQRFRHTFDVRHVVGDSVHKCGLELGFVGAPVVSCRDCDFLFKLKRPSSKYLDHYYAELGEGYLASLGEDHREIRRDFHLALDLLVNAFPIGGAILDVGCASGFFLGLLGASWNRSGIELFHLAAEQARRRGGITIHECDLQSAQLPGGSFDVVCCFDVVEHLADPLPVLLEVRRVLKPGGWFVLGTGDSSSLTARLSGRHWTYLCIPEHISFFNHHSLKCALMKAGFSQFSFKRVHHGEISHSVVMGWLRAVIKHWAVTFFGEDIVGLRIFRQNTAEFLVPYFFDHLICIAK